MKKILFSLIALMAVMTVQAQSICSTWRTLQPVVETDNDGSFTAQSYTYTFNADGTFYFVDELTLATQPERTMEQEVATNIEIRGTYTLEGDKLTIKPNMNTYKTDLLSTSINGRVVNSAKVKKSVNAKINSASFKEKFAGTKTYTVRIGDASLEMSDGRQAINYMRLATIRN